MRYPELYDVVMGTAKIEYGGDIYEFSGWHGRNMMLRCTENEILMRVPFSTLIDSSKFSFVAGGNEGDQN